MKKKPRYGVMSVRLNPERLALMKRYGQVLDDVKAVVQCCEDARLVV